MDNTLIMGFGKGGGLNITNRLGEDENRDIDFKQEMDEQDREEREKINNDDFARRERDRDRGDEDE